ncbi:lysozyme [Nocardioides speluncae]|uniref:lysozyme n=1 Tax=Nocardioides speluncae TaxID=2670337 RepID=UPI000D69CB7E|nr:lysozyme [Nocardioides speluncae]
MSPTKTRLRALAATAAAALTTLALAAPPTNAVDVPSDRDNRTDRTPTAAAKREGVTTANGGYLGWKTPETGNAPEAQTRLAATVAGMDVASYQGNVNWASWWNAGKRFAYVKATEGRYYRNPYFAQQYNGSYNIGMIRGAYHFANPNDSSGRAQAEYFVARGGGWSRDGKTLPGVLDIEYNPYGPSCWGMSASQLVSWIRDFTTRYKQLTGRDAVIYTAYNWWSPCTGNSTAFNTTNPLWVARYSSSPGTLPGGWPFWTFWQYTSTPLDQNYFNGSYDRLRVLANGG